MEVGSLHAVLKEIADCCLRIYLSRSKEERFAAIRRGCEGLKDVQTLAMKYDGLPAKSMIA